MGRILVITHNDFDGIFSGAMLVRGLRDAGKIVSDLEISTPRRLARTLQGTVSGFTLPDEIYLADLALNVDQEAAVLKVLNLLKEQGKKVVWVDHHRWDRGVLDRTGYFCELNVSQQEKTAAQLIANELFPDNAAVARLLRLLYHQPPEAGTPWAKRWLDYLTAIVATRQPGKVRQAVLELAHKDAPGALARFSMWFATLGRRVKNVADLPCRKEATRGGKTLAVVDLRGSGLNINAVYRDLIAAFEPDLYLAVLENTRLQIGKGTLPRLDLGPLHGRQEHEGARFEVQGHGYVAAVTVALSFKSILRGIFSGAYPAELESFIRLVKERY